MPRLGGQPKRAVGVVLSGLLVVVSACSSGGGCDDNSAASAVPAGAPTASATGSSATGAATTSVTAATTATTLSTEDSLYAAQVELSEKLMTPVKGWRRAWATCLADTSVCDYDALVAPYLSGPARDGLRQSFTAMRDKGQNVRGSDPDGIYFVQYSVTRDVPLQAGVEVCEVIDGVIYTRNADGSENIVSDEPQRAQLNVLVVEEQADGTLTIDKSQELTGDQNIKADNCDQYSELPASR